MTTPPNQNDATKVLSPDGLANQLFDAAFMQFKGDQREAARQVIQFLIDALGYALTASERDPVARKVLLKSVGDMIANGGSSPEAPPAAPAAPAAPTAPTAPTAPVAPAGKP